MDIYRDNWQNVKQNLPIIALGLNFIGFINVAVFHLFLYNPSETITKCADPTIYDTVDMAGRMLFEASGLCLFVMWLYNKAWSNTSWHAFYVLVAIQSLNFVYIMGGFMPDIYFGLIGLVFYVWFLCKFFANLTNDK